MAAKSSFANMVICLTLVCLVCAAVLGSIYSVTKDPIDATRAAQDKAAIAKVLPEGGEISDPLAVGSGGVIEYSVQTAADSSVLAYAVKTVTTEGFGGNIVLMVGVLPDGTVYNTTVLEHSETPGLGAKCTEENSHFREQWKGFKGVLAVTKDKGDVDAITASTETSRAYTKAVKQAVEFVESMED